METHENYTRQHQDIRVEDGVAYGDVLEGVNFEYTATLTALNAITLASLAWAPPPPTEVQITEFVGFIAHTVIEEVIGDRCHQMLP